MILTITMMPSCRAKEELCPHPSGHQPAAQPGSPLPGTATAPPPASRRQPGPPLVGGRAGAHQLRRHQEVGVGATSAPRRPPQQRLQRRGGARPVRLCLARRHHQAASGARHPLGRLAQPGPLQLQPPAEPQVPHALSAAGGAASDSTNHPDPL